MFERIVGQRGAKGILAGALRKNSLSHAYLFCGPKGVGKETMAIELAMRLNCESETGCGTCNSCRRIKEGIHPDVRFIKAKGPSIKIDEIRQMTNFIAMTSYEAKYKVGIIVGAEAMRDEAANCLLKTIEEPPKGSLIILTAQNQYALLPTIQSRVQKVHFQRLSIAEIKAFLEEYTNIESQEAVKLAEFSGGSIGKALELKDSENMQILLGFANNVLENITDLLPHEIIDISSNIGKDRLTAISFLDLLSDALRLKGLKQEFSIVFGKEYSITQVASILNYIEKLKHYIRGYGNSQLALEGLFIRICRL